MTEPNRSLDEPQIPISNDSSQRVISGFWIRLFALLIDGLLLGLLGVILGFFLFDVLAQLGGWGRLVGFLIAGLYFGVLNSSIGGGRTIGKRLLKIEVINRVGCHLSLSKSLLRYVVFGSPFFLNGAAIPGEVLISPIGYLIAFIIFGVGGAIVYLYLFNRRTRQSLHDFAVGSYVTRVDSSGELSTIAWPHHRLVVGIWIVAVVVLLAIMPGLSRKGVFPELLDTQRAIEASGHFHSAAVSVGTTWTTINEVSSEHTYVRANAILNRRPVDYKSAAWEVASIVLRNYQDIMHKDLLAINVSYGYDIGFSKFTMGAKFSYSPSKWHALLTEKPPKMTDAQQEPAGNG